MLKHLTALAIKFGYTLLIILTILTIYDMPTMYYLLLALIIAVPAYILGDLFFLPQFGNLIATIADFVMYVFAITFALIYFVDVGVTGFVWASFVAAFLVFIEALYHAFVMPKVINVDKAKPLFKAHQLQTEFAEEQDFKDFIDNETEKEKEK